MKVLYNNERSFNVFRIKILLYTFMICSRNEGENEYYKLGITKLVKLDSFLRESSLFNSLIKYKRNNSTSDEKKEILNLLSRYKEDEKFNYYVSKFWYGPYDLEYEDFLLYMYSKNLIEIEKTNYNELYFINEKTLKSVEEEIFNDDLLKEYYIKSQILYIFFKNTGPSKIVTLMKKLNSEIGDANIGTTIAFD